MVRNRIFSFLLTVILLFAFSATTVGAADVTNRWNIVFVNDESGSMKTHDRNQLRYEAIRRFVALMAESGNRVGSVSFDSEIVDKIDVHEIEGMASKEALVDQVASCTPLGQTNIGLALKTAVENLDKNKNPEIPSAVILLTDGATEVPDNMVDQSRQDMADALERAREANYKIYTICLGNAGTEHARELEQIAEATGGEHVVVSNVNDLEDVETMFYRIIFRSSNDEAIPGTIGNDGTITRSFLIPPVSVEELNIIIEGEVNGLTITAPNGKAYNDADLEKICMKGESFGLYKLVDPDGGTWTVTARGVPGTEIRFKPLCNSNLRIISECDASREYHVGDNLDIRVQMADSRGPVTDFSKYEGFSAELVVRRGEEEMSINLPLTDNGFEGSYSFSAKGSYEFTTRVSGYNITADDEKVYRINLDNCPPVVKQEKYEITVYRMPFDFIKMEDSIDLTNCATDTDGDPVTYSIASSAFMREDYTLEDNVLRVNNWTVGKGSFTVIAADDSGGETAFEVLFRSVNVGLLTVILLTLGTIIVLIAVGAVIKEKSKRRFYCDLQLDLDNNGEYGSTTICKTKSELGKGKVYLRKIGVPRTVFPPDAYIEAFKNKNKKLKNRNVMLVSKSGFFTESGPKKKKLIIKCDNPGVFLYMNEADRVNSTNYVQIEITTPEDEFQY